MRPCRVENCIRRTDWPADPSTKAAFCAEHTREMWRTGTMPPPLPRWIERAATLPNGLARDLTDRSAA